MAHRVVQAEASPPPPPPAAPPCARHPGLWLLTAVLGERMVIRETPDGGAGGRMGSFMRRQTPLP